MIQGSTGVLIEVGWGKLLIIDIESIIKLRDRKKADPTTKPQGCTLLKGQY